MNFTLSVNLSKLKNVGVMEIQGQSSTKRCVVIPIEDNQLYASERGVVLSLSAWEGKQVGKYGDTHYVKQRFTKDYRESHQEEMKQTPIIGNMKPMSGAAATQTVVQYTADDGNDYAF